MQQWDKLRREVTQHTKLNSPLQCPWQPWLIDHRSPPGAPSCGLGTLPVATATHWLGWTCQMKPICHVGADVSRTYSSSDFLIPNVYAPIEQPGEVSRAGTSPPSTAQPAIRGWTSSSWDTRWVGPGTRSLWIGLAGIIDSLASSPVAKDSQDLSQWPGRWVKHQSIILSRWSSETLSSGQAGPRCKTRKWVKFLTDSFYFHLPLIGAQLPGLCLSATTFSPATHTPQIISRTFFHLRGEHSDNSLEWELILFQVDTQEGGKKTKTWVRTRACCPAAVASGEVLTFSWPWFSFQLNLLWPPACDFQEIIVIPWLKGWGTDGSHPCADD